MSDSVDVAIIGAGPYGLSVAAHLRAAGVSFRQFGLPMHLWRACMPRGMFLKSQGFASNMSDPAGAYTLATFCRAAGLPYADYGLPVPLDAFVAYGDWFASKTAGDCIEQTAVTRLAGRHGHFEITLANGGVATARRVVLAVGVEHFAYLPPVLSAARAVHHSSEVTQPPAYRGMRVAVVGRGQSALESAALLREHGADVQIITRSAAVKWNGPPLLPDRPLRQRLREPEAGLGSGWATWFYSRQPGLFRHLPEPTRVQRARTALGPAGASWLRSRVEGEIPILTGQSVARVRTGGNGTLLDLVSRTGSHTAVEADQLIAATGYRPDLRRLEFLDDALRAGLRLVANTAAVDSGYQSSVPGLYVIGPAVAPVFGPVMRFVYGTGHAASTVAARLAASAAAPALTGSPHLAAEASR